MTVRELDREQIKQLKINLLEDEYERAGDGSGLSYGEIALIDLIVSDDDVYAAYRYTVFSDDDFC